MCVIQSLYIYICSCLKSDVLIRWLIMFTTFVKINIIILIFWGGINIYFTKQKLDNSFGNNYIVVSSPYFKDVLSSKYTGHRFNENNRNLFPNNDTKACVFYQDKVFNIQICAFFSLCSLHQYHYWGYIFY